MKHYALKKVASTYIQTRGVGFWTIFYYLWQNNPCTLYFCAGGKSDYELSWRNF